MPSPESTAPILVVGMHRSGTSYLAHVLQSLGVHLGPELVGAQRGNPRGHFEDKGILAFHEAALARRHQPNRCLYDDGTMIQTPVEAHFTAEEATAAQALLAERQQAGPWGWKEPRTSLFLPAWLPLLPQARVIVLVRHPLEVHFSMIRRGYWETVVWSDHVLRSWLLHYAAILEAERQAERPFLWLNPAQAFADPAALRQQLKTALNLEAHAREEAEFAAQEFHQLQRTAADDASFHLAAPEVAAWWEVLQTDQPEARAALRLGGLPEPTLEQQGIWRRLEASVAQANGLDLETPYAEHRADLVQRVRQTEQWNAEAAAIHESNAFLNAELEKIGTAYAEQQAFLAQQQETMAWLEAERTRLGAGWVKQRDYLQNVDKLREHLEAERRTLYARLGEEPPPL